MKRTWRVGTISMGTALIFLGVFLILTNIFSLDLTTVWIAWWPVLLIVLGIEILMYLFLSKRENPIIKYDFLSIFFVGLLGMAALLFMLASASGIVSEIEYTISAEQQTYDLPPVTEDIDQAIDRIVIHAKRQPIAIEGSDEREVKLFGTYLTTVSRQNDVPPVMSPDEYVSFQTSGNTLYVNVKELSKKMGPMNGHSEMHPIIVVPSEMQVEVRGGYEPIAVHPGHLQNDWFIQGQSHINVQLNKDSDVSVIHSSPNEMEVMTVREHTVEHAERTVESENSPIKTIGNGTHAIHIVESHNISVHVLGKSTASTSY